MVDKKPIRLDWSGVESDYKAGILSIGMVAAKWGISLANLNRMANAKGWVRQEIAHVNPPPMGGGVPAMDVLTAAEASGIQARQILAIVNEHRRDIHKVRGIANLMVERLALILDGQPVDKPLMGGRESPSDVLGKVARAMFEAIRLEREVLGLETHSVMSDNSGEPGSEWEDVKKLLNDLYLDKVGTSHEEK